MKGKKLLALPVVLFLSVCIGLLIKFDFFSSPIQPATDVSGTASQIQEETTGGQSVFETVDRDMYTVAKAPVAGLKYVNGIFYDREYKNNPDSKEVFYNAQGEIITPDIETKVFEGKIKQIAYEKNADKNSQGEVFYNPYKFTIEVIRYNGGTAVRANSEIVNREMVTPRARVQAVKEKFAIIQLADNLYMLDLDTLEISEILNGEYPGITYRTYDSEYGLQKFRTCWADFRNISDNGKYIIFYRGNDVGVNGELRGKNGNGPFLKNLETGEENYLGTDVDVLVWDNDIFYSQFVYKVITDSNGKYKNSIYAISQYDCISHETKIINDNIEKSLRAKTNLYPGIAKGWSIQVTDTALVVEDIIADKKFEITLPEPVEINEVRYLSIFPDGRNIAFGDIIQKDGDFKSSAYILYNYAEKSAADKTLLSIEIENNLIDSMKFFDNDSLLAHASRGTCIINLSK